MQTDILIIGQGICGTMLSWFLYKAGKSFVVIDDAEANAPSKVAAGIINPVTGRRFAYSWMIDIVMPFAAHTYREIGTFLDKKLLTQKDIIYFFPSAQMRDAFATRLTENDTYLHAYPDHNQFNPYFQNDYGCGQIHPAYLAGLQTLLESWREFLKEKHLLSTETCIIQELNIQPQFVQYKNIRADKIIFCDGIASMNNPWFKDLPFSPSKGEVLIIESSDIPDQHIFKRNLMLAPMARKNIFWAGTSYQWEYEHPYPTGEFYQQTKQQLDSWLKVPYKIVDHWAALRPSTLERRPFVGFHPRYKNVGILNGMGTKGTSLAPFFASQLVQHLLMETPLTNEAGLGRFSKILSQPGWKKS
jgi:glycine/D-amino acid oxidase-like deaminating enzyme